MADIHITRQAAAQRQLDAAIRILFSGEDELAIHTLVSAAHNVLTDLDNRSGRKSLNLYAETLADLQAKHPGIPLPGDVEEFRRWMQKKNRIGANFLKHADRDARNALDASALWTDNLLLEACGIYSELGFEPTPEMRAFGRWHLAIYPSEEGDRLVCESGDVSTLTRDQQLEFGLFLVDSLGQR